MLKNMLFFLSHFTTIKFKQSLRIHTYHLELRYVDIELKVPRTPNYEKEQNK